MVEMLQMPVWIDCKFKKKYRLIQLFKSVLKASSTSALVEPEWYHDITLNPSGESVNGSHFMLPSVNELI